MDASQLRSVATLIDMIGEFASEHDTVSIMSVNLTITDSGIDYSILWDEVNGFYVVPS